MSLDDVLLHIDSYPEATSSEAIDQAVNLVALLGGKLSALAVQLGIPLGRNRIADHLIGLSGLVQEEEAKSLNACKTSLEYFRARAEAAGIFHEALLESADLFEYADYVAKRARTRDFCIVPVSDSFGSQQDVARCAIFDSGRPVLLLRENATKSPDLRIGTIMLAWDGGRCASRAMADALPILAQAGAVRVLTIVNEKTTVVTGQVAEAARHLRAHGISAVCDEVDAGGQPIGVVLDQYLRSHAPDLVVMGAYGHSRMREIVLGGATVHMLRHAQVPVFMSH